ncbi:chymotrypsin-like elastase family member 3B [Ochotona curzoniae]|uniref:chymotrypsin-like elastase family member 3B n=1 Tax=Ochotona curzoniae TaxID=130825 RepID=UPI001B353ECD|nr:chymotrypsin-like elastase family member 3B [Ochotona curzoniae]
MALDHGRSGVPPPVLEWGPAKPSPLCLSVPYIRVLVPFLLPFFSRSTMIRLLSSLLLVALASGSHPPIHIPSTHFANPSSRVVNGVPVDPPHSKPWQVALLLEQNGGLYFICGGSLIDRDWVLTAAHCVVDGGPYWVLLGRYNLSEPEPSDQVIPVGKVYVHPEYDNNNAAKGYDIALLKLYYSAVLTAEVQPGHLPPPGYILPHGTTCCVTGWGYTSTNGPISDVLLKGLLPVIDYAHCSQWDYWGSTVKEIHVCAGEAGSSACSGDSGGPLNCPGVNAECEIHGIVSFGSGYGCNFPKKPTVFTRVSAFIDWIEEITGIHFR